MRRFIQVWLLLSVIATAVFGYLYFTGDRTRTISFETSDGSRVDYESAPARRGLEGGEGAGPRERLREFRADRQERIQERRDAASRQDFALMISVASSIISAFAAILQTVLTHRAARNTMRPNH